MDLVVKHRDREAKLHLEHREEGYRITIDGQHHEVDAREVSAGTHSLIIDGRQYMVTVRAQKEGRYRVSHVGGTDEVELMDPLTHLARQSHVGAGSGAQVVNAYMPGRVIQILVEDGEEVVAGQALVVLEAMKMENEILAERPGVVTKILVTAGQAVEGGDALFEIT